MSEDHSSSRGLEPAVSGARADGGALLIVADRIEIARIVYTALGHEEDEPWDASHQRRANMGMSVPWSGNQLAAFGVADALIAKALTPSTPSPA